MVNGDVSTFHAAFMFIESPEYLRFPSKSHDFFLWNCHLFEISFTQEFILCLVFF
jgi:hypothetical protein